MKFRRPVQSAIVVEFVGYERVKIHRHSRQQPGPHGGASGGGPDEAIGSELETFPFVVLNSFSSFFAPQ
jgi:hypothetical protein